MTSRPPSGAVSSAIKRTIFDGLVFGYIGIFCVVAVLRPESELLIEKASVALLVSVGLFVLGCALGGALSAGGRRTLGEVIYASPASRGAPPEYAPFYQTTWGIQLALAVAVTLILGYRTTNINVLRLVEIESLQHAMRLFAQLASPDWAILPKAIVKVIESVYIAFMATAIAVPLAFVLSFFTARNVMAGSRLGMVTYTALRTVFNVVRSVEPVLWAVIFSIWVSFGPFAGMLALMVHSIASLSKQYSEIIEGVEDGPIEGIASTGAGRLQTIWFAIVPQIVLPFISFTIYRWDINVRMATILGFVGGGGIGTMLMEYQGQARWPQVGTIIVVIAFVVWVMDIFSAHVRAAVKS